ncbi:MAG: type II toxin-antitoxin system RelE/ParE family toxin [Methyloceanibacter sp.]
MHKLTGERKGQWAMTVNARWRICFHYRKGDAYDVEIVDYHRG